MLGRFPGAVTTVMAGLMGVFMLAHGFLGTSGTVP